MKVYCKDCRHFSIKHINPYAVCTYKYNTIEHERNGWYEKIIITEYIKKPEELNKNNDCKWFEKEDDK